MALLFVMVMVCMATSTQGAECNEGQHCSDCDTAGTCLQDCDKGHFGHKCKSQCSITCRYKTCTLVEDRGIGKCTDGCVPGYQGISCDIPCDQVVECTLCPRGCDGDYCQLGGACFAGCRDSFYGAECKTCPSHCRTCNRMTGVCDECDPTHHGVNCEKSCENCAGSCKSNCECVPGFYGDFCAETCSKTCRPKSVHKSLPFPGMTSDNCTGECHKHSAECLHGCVDGWFGPTCSSPCNPGCRHQRCNATGSCAEGCEPHHFGPACEPCPETCVNQTCDSNNGSCVDGCRDGLYGEHCNETCTLCPRGVCDQHTGICVTDCNNTQEGREVNWTQPCSPPGCTTGYRNTTLRTEYHISTTTLTSVVCAVVLFVLVASSVGCVCFRNGPCIQRASKTDIVSHNNVSEQGGAYTDYQVLHQYWDIREELGDGMPSQNYKRTSGAEMLVLADYFSSADRNVDIEARLDDIEVRVDDIEARVDDIEARDDDIEASDGTTSSSVTDSHSYTHIMRDVFVADPRTVASYISPLEDPLNIRESKDDINVSNGDTEASDGDIEAIDEDIEPGDGDIDASNGDIEASDGDIETYDGDIEASDGDIHASYCHIEAGDGDINASDGDIIASDGDNKVNDGDIEASDSDIDAGD